MLEESSKRHTHQSLCLLRSHFAFVNNVRPLYTLEGTLGNLEFLEEDIFCGCLRLILGVLYLLNHATFCAT